jgi:two-component system sensor kinase FixL
MEKSVTYPDLARCWRWKRNFYRCAILLSLGWQLSYPGQSALAAAETVKASGIVPARAPAELSAPAPSAPEPKPSIWQRYEWDILGALLLCVIEAGLITALWLQLRRRRHAEVKLIESEERFRLLVSTVKDYAIFWIDLEGRVMSWNAGAEHIKGYRPEEIVGQHFSRFFTAEDIAAGKPEQGLQMALAQGRYEEEGWRVRKDGSKFQASALITAVRDEAGQLRGFAKVTRDLTERNQADRRLRESEERYRSLFTAMAEGVVLQAADGAIAACNASAESILGLSADQMMGRTSVDPHWNAIHEDGSPFPGETHPAMVSLRTGQSSSNVVMGVHKPDGALTWISINSQPIFRPGEPKPYAVVVTFADISDRRNAEIEVQRLHQELSHMGRVTMMGELTAALAHELNQPLTAILSNTQAAQRFLAQPQPDLEELRAILADIVADDQRAGEVIGRVRSLMKKGGSERRPLDLNDLIEDVARLVRSDALLKNVLVTLHLQPHLPKVCGDRVQLQQALLNLLVNALDSMKDTPIGERHLCLSATQTDTLSVLITVADRGTGIPPEKMELVFEPFFTSKPEGMGMGLPICRSIIEAHGGRIWVTNNPGRGASFCFSLPVMLDPNGQQAENHKT